MKLSDLIRLKEQVDNLSCNWEAEQLNKEIESIIDYCQSDITQTNVNELIEQQQKIVNEIQEFSNRLQKLKNYLAQTVKDQDPGQFDLEQQYWENFKNDLSFAIVNRRFTTDPISDILLRERLTSKVSWQYPALVFRPKHALHLDCLVASDPMYWVDTDQDLMNSVSDLFNPDYQRRVCKYILPDSQTVDLGVLPRSQFGLVYACRYFNFRPLSVIQDYLKQVFGLLRSGGCFVFTYNNCDTTSGALAFEHFGGCYTPARMVKQLAVDIGYIVDFEYSDTAGLSWLELKKPGSLTSIRAGQTLAAIKNIVDESDHPEKSARQNDQPTQEVKFKRDIVDLNDKDIYNEQTLLVEIATMLGLDLNMSLTKGQPNPKKLRRMITAYFKSDQFPAEKINRLLAKRKSQ